MTDQQNQKLIGENQEAKNSKRNFDEIHPKNMGNIDRKYSEMNNRDKENDDLVDVQNYEANPKKTEDTVDQENEEINDRYSNHDVIVRDDQETIDKKYQEKVVKKNYKTINRTNHESTDQQNHELILQENHGPIDQENHVSLEKENLEVFTVKKSDVDVDPKNPKRLFHKNDEVDLEKTGQHEDEFSHVYQKSNVTNQRIYPVHELDSLRMDEGKSKIDDIQSNENGILGASMDHKRNENSFTKSTWRVASVQANEEKSVDIAAHFKLFTSQHTVVNLKEHKSVPQYTMSPLRNDVDKDDFAAKDFNGDFKSRVKN